MSVFEYEGPVIGVIEPGPSWEDVYGAIGVEVWKLTPQDYQDSHHRDLTFLTCWQNVMEAVARGIEAVGGGYE